jgi:tRNA pseudouridine55 synthase
MSNILLIDKPSGITSFDVIRKLRRQLGIRKMGHAGTLDPLASGLLIIALNEATKQLGDFMNLPKEYEVLIEFGKTSNTYDADGVILCHPEPVEGRQSEVVTLAELQSALKTFTGEILQTPPAFSAKRINGQHAYDLARKGIEVKLEPKKVTVHSIDILSFEWPFVSLRIKCSKGTYIRSIAHDLGQKLGCGGYVKALRRTAIGEYKVEGAQKLEEA